jgi:hypothetical protein
MKWLESKLLPRLHVFEVGDDVSCCGKANRHQCGAIKPGWPKGKLCRGCFEVFLAEKGWEGDKKTRSRHFQRIRWEAAKASGDAAYLERIKASTMRWQKANPERMKASIRRYMERRAAKAGRVYVPWANRPKRMSPTRASVYFDALTIADLEGTARRLGWSTSRVIQQAWVLARETVRRLPSAPSAGPVGSRPTHPRGRLTAASDQHAKDEESHAGLVEEGPVGQPWRPTQDT